VFAAALLCCLSSLAGDESSKGPRDGTVVKEVPKMSRGGKNLLGPDKWSAYEQGFQRKGAVFVCENGGAASAKRGAAQGIALNQTQPEPIVASAWSKAEGVTGSADHDYSVYVDLVYTDGTSLWGQVAQFKTGTHDWQRSQVAIFPEKPVKSLSCYLMFRNHGGKASFRGPELRVVSASGGIKMFDGVAVIPRPTQTQGFQVRDVAAGSDFVRIEHEALGLKLEHSTKQQGIALIHDVTLSDTTGKDRAVTLVYAYPLGAPGSGNALGSGLPTAPRGRPKVSKEPRKTAPSASLRWLEDPRRNVAVEPGREYVHATNFNAGSNGRLSLYPLGAVADERRGLGLGIDMAHPAFFRIGYSAATGEFFLAYDIGLTPEKPSARLRFCQLRFDPKWGFRGALAEYYAVFPEAFRCGTPEQGLWMPFAKISQVKGWEDFYFKFKEGNDETAWDDAHGIITFRYTEPMTWWMSMPKAMPRTLEAALAEARRLADKGDASAKALLTSGYHNADGEIPARLLDTPWCNGAVWSMNSMPAIRGEVTDFKNKWSPKIRDELYGPKRRGDLDGEYVDSSEGYVTDELDFRRDHFAAADTPLAFSPDGHKPAIFRGLIAFEYVRGLAQDVHAMKKLMMANGAPSRLCWLCPLLEVLGTETDWQGGGKWHPMYDSELLYRRVLCKGKPYCFLMNTDFDKFSSELVEKYMKRSLAYGMFPGFFSHNAAEGHYFTRPALYDRDRPLFKKYVPLCKLVAEAGWEPVTLARSSDDRVYVERFGGETKDKSNSPRYLTVFNDSPDRRTVTITLEGQAPTSSRELVRGKSIPWEDGKATFSLDGEDLAVVELR